MANPILPPAVLDILMKEQEWPQVFEIEVETDKGPLRLRNTKPAPGYGWETEVWYEGAWVKWAGPIESWTDNG